MTGDKPRRESYVPAKLVEGVANRAIRDFVFDEVGELRRKIDAIAGYMRKQIREHDTNHVQANAELQEHFDTILKMFGDQTQKNDMQDLNAIEQKVKLAKLINEIELDFDRDIWDNLPELEKIIHGVGAKFVSLDKSQKRAAKDTENKHVALARQNDTKFEQLDKRIQTYQHDTTRSIGVKFDRSDAKFETHHTKIIEVENLANAKPMNHTNTIIVNLKGQLKN